jgi:endonuclease-3
MAASSKTQLLDTVYTLLKKRYKLEPRDGRMSVLEAVLYGICHEGTTRENANQAISRFKDAFYDWNEVRVSPLHELQETLAGSPRRSERAEALRRFLRQLFEKTYGFTLDGLTKKPLKEAIKVLQEYEAPRSDFVLATVIQKALGGHALPIDGRVRLALERLGVADPDEETTVLRAALERAIPKNRGEDFIDLMEELCHDTCLETLPECGRCELRKICPTGIRRQEVEREAAKAARKAPAKAATAPAPKPAAKTPAKKATGGRTPAPKSTGRGGASTPKRRGTR